MSKFTYGPEKTKNGKVVRHTHHLDCTVYEALSGEKKRFHTHSEMMEALGGGEIPRYVGKTKGGKYILVREDAWSLDLPSNLKFPHLRGTVIVADHLGWNQLPVFKPIDFSKILQDVVGS